MSNTKPIGCPHSRIDDEWDNDDEFVPFDRVCTLRGLGYNSPSFTGYAYNSGEITTQAITYSQAFRWLRKKHGLYYAIMPYMHGNIHTHFWHTDTDGIIRPLIPFECVVVHKTYEEAQLVCLDVLIKNLQEI